MTQCLCQYESKLGRVAAYFTLATGVRRTELIVSINNLKIVLTEKKLGMAWQRDFIEFEINDDLQSSLKLNKIRRTFQTKTFQKQFYKPLRKLISQKALNRVKWVNLGHKTLGGPQLFVSQNTSPPLPFVLFERNINQKHFSIQLFNRTYCLKNIGTDW